MGNNEQIDKTSYYVLPSGRQLEDFIFDWDLDFATGSALKYLWRAGRKDGECAAKDKAKAEHFIRFIARHTEDVDEEEVRENLRGLVSLALRDCEFGMAGKNGEKPPETARQTI